MWCVICSNSKSELPGEQSWSVAKSECVIVVFVWTECQLCVCDLYMHCIVICSITWLWTVEFVGFTFRLPQVTNQVSLVGLWKVYLCLVHNCFVDLINVPLIRVGCSLRFTNCQLWITALWDLTTAVWSYKRPIQSCGNIVCGFPIVNCELLLCGIVHIHIVDCVLTALLVYVVTKNHESNMYLFLVHSGCRFFVFCFSKDNFPQKTKPVFRVQPKKPIYGNWKIFFLLLRKAINKNR